MLCHVNSTAFPHKTSRFSPFSVAFSPLPFRISHVSSRLCAAGPRSCPGPTPPLPASTTTAIAAPLHRQPPHRLRRGRDPRIHLVFDRGRDGVGPEMASRKGDPPTRASCNRVQLK
ncbi:hypothetical protein PVAP13_9NG426100 [Panicum virgatum]|uniref:Uncharacterized protein n=1 Tax=Panicum virgatum TaxID=38727 RepID=A0A8T0MMV8_PANVG|nr:hypothetical protein PVAP13_9NG426100 [Panicum virgatum]